jgi:hypothetical protein
MTTLAFSAPEPDDVRRGLEQIERYVANHNPAPTPVVEPSVAEEGETRRVRALRAQVAEAHRLAALQGDDTPLLVDSPKVRKRRLKAAEAARLHELAQDPMMRAWQAARMRRLLVAVSLVSLTLALGWSTAGVQAFAADGAPAYSPAWWFAWCVEPFISLALLVVVGSRAYLATRGAQAGGVALPRVEPGHERLAVRPLGGRGVLLLPPGAAPDGARRGGGDRDRSADHPGGVLHPRPRGYGPYWPYVQGEHPAPERDR